MNVLTLFFSYKLDYEFKSKRKLEQYMRNVFSIVLARDFKNAETMTKIEATKKALFLNCTKLNCSCNCRSY